MGILAGITDKSMSFFEPTRKDLFHNLEQICIFFLTVLEGSKLLWKLILNELSSGCGFPLEIVVSLFYLHYLNPVGPLLKRLPRDISSLHPNLHIFGISADWHKRNVSCGIM